MPKLNIIAANDALDEDLLDARMIKRQIPSLSPSPSPIPMDAIDPEIDPDNVVTRGSYTDDENENDNDDDKNEKYNKK